MKSKVHPGFKAIQAKIAKKQGVSMESAGAILASASRKASPAAKAKNPALKRVAGRGRLMLNEMNKHMNHLSMGTLMNVEMREHRLKKAPTRTELLKMEQREHKLGSRPTMRQAMEAEYAEHSNAEGKLVIRPSKAQEAKATAIYKRGK